MTRSVSNIDLGGRIRQFVFLIVVASVAMVVSVAFFGKTGSGRVSQDGNIQHSTTRSAASF